MTTRVPIARPTETNTRLKDVAPEDLRSSDAYLKNGDLSPAVYRTLLLAAFHGTPGFAGESVCRTVADFVGFGRQDCGDVTIFVKQKVHVCRGNFREGIQAPLEVPSPRSLPRKGQRRRDYKRALDGRKYCDILYSEISNNITISRTITKLPQ